MDRIGALLWPIFEQYGVGAVDEIKYFHVFGESNLGALYVTYDDLVYGIGFNGPFNLLGISLFFSHQDVVFSPKCVEELCSEDIQSISVGGEMGAAVTSNGELFLWGRGYEEEQHVSVLLPHKVYVGDEEFISVACGDMFAAALTFSGKIYLWGSIHLKAAVCNKFLVSGSLIITSFDCGRNHLAMVDECGTAYTCGFGSFGQLGRRWRAQERFLAVSPVNIDSGSTAVVCGLYSTLFLNKMGSVFTCGKNNFTYGYIGIPSNGNHIDVPTKVNLREKITHVASNKEAISRFAVRSASGRIYIWGQFEMPRILCNAVDLVVAFYGRPTPSNLESLVTRIRQPKRNRRRPDGNTRAPHRESGDRNTRAPHRESGGRNTRAPHRESGASSSFTTNTRPQRLSQNSDVPLSHSSNQTKINASSTAIAEIVQDILNLQDEVQNLFATFSPLLDRELKLK